MTGQTPPQPVTVTVAGVKICDAAEVVRCYLRWAPGTIQRYDALAGTFSEITEDLVRATYVVRSHMRSSSIPWLVERGKTAPWTRIGSDVRLVDCDPSVKNGAYDDMCTLWYHFVDARPNGLGRTQINKVLYLMNPNVFPIFDDRLHRRYKAEATRLYPGILKARGGTRMSTDDFGWEPFRRDLKNLKEVFKKLRGQVAATPVSPQEVAGIPIHEWAAKNLTDLRLLDILVWSLG